MTRRHAGRDGVDARFREIVERVIERADREDREHLAKLKPTKRAKVNFNPTLSARQRKTLEDL